MNDAELRAILEYHAKELSALNKETQRGYGTPRKLEIVERIRRMLELAEGLE
jgi:hypothetical protein